MKTLVRTKIHVNALHRGEHTGPVADRIGGQRSFVAPRADSLFFSKRAGLPTDVS
jgi:hypothetical protein